MPDIYSKEKRHYIMSKVHSASTKPEIKLRCALWRQGFRYRKNVRQLPGSPDIVLPKYRTVIFVHGCFWHGHKGCKNYTIPKTNTDFWKAKISRNQTRDQEVWRQLEAQGWAVIIVWECQLKKAYPEATIDRVETEIKKNGESYLQARADRRKSKEDYHKENSARKKREESLKAVIKSRG